MNFRRVRILVAVMFWQTAWSQIIGTFAGTNWIFPASSGPAVSAPLGLLGGVAVDAQGNTYTADNSNNIVARISPSGVLTVIAGNRIAGFSGDGGPATSAALNLPSGVALDPAGNLYIADYSNNRIRKVSGGTITTVAGNGRAGFGGDGGLAMNASLNNPNGVAVDSAGNLFIADTLNNRIRKVSGTTITTVAGNANQGFGGDGGSATSAALNFPTGVAVDSAGNIYIADLLNNRVRKVSGGIITTAAGNGSQGYSGDGGPAISASLNYPAGVGLDSAGILYIADSNNRIRKVSGGAIMTVAGNGTKGFTGDSGPATAASLYNPEGVAVDASGDLYIADTFNYRIRKVSGGMITTTAGNGAYEFSGDGGAATSASLNLPIGGSVDSAGNVYVADTFNNRIRKVSGGIIATVAGDARAGDAGDGGPATSASLNNPQGVIADSAGNLYIADTNNNRVRKVSAGTITTIAGNGTAGYSGDGGPATSASLNGPVGLALDSAGDLYISDTGNNRIRKLTNGTITTVAGNGSLSGGFYGDGGSATSAALNSPAGLALDSAGDLYIADTKNNRIRKISGGTITSVAGNGHQGYSGDGQPATTASLFYPAGVAVDSTGNLYIADSENNRMRKVSAGTISTIAGNGNTGYSGDGGLAADALLFNPTGVGIDPAGNVYIVDYNNQRIRVVLASAPLFAASSPAGGLSLSAPSGGKPATTNLTVSTTIAAGSAIAIPGMAYTAQVSSGAPWLSISPQSGATPGLLTVTADPANLAPNTYQGTITLSVPLANPPTRSINVQFTVTAAVPASLSVDHNHLSFTYANTSAARTQTITVSNTGGGSLPFNVSITPNPGQSASWLSLTPASGTATPAAAVVLNVQADPTGLAANTYSANIVISSASGSASVSVVMTISTNPLIMLLSQTGLTFTAVQNGGSIPTQAFSVLNLGSGTLNWTAQTSVLGGVNNWLVATPDSGVSNTAASSSAPVVTVSVNPIGLAPGTYYGLVTVTSAGAANTPQGVIAILQVLPAGSDIAPVVQPSSLIFTGAAGDSSPGSQNVQVYDPTGTNKSFRSEIVTANGGNWLVTLPADATIPSSGPVPVVVQPLVNSLAPGTYQGTLTLQFSDGRLSKVGLQFVVTGASGASPNAIHGVRPEQSSTACVSNQLMPSLLTLGSGFSVPAGYPQGLEAQVVDNCNSPQVDGTVYVQFSNGDAPVRLRSLGNGVWDGTWPVGSTPASVTLTVAAQNAASVKGQSQIIGGLSAAMPSPMIPSDGVVSTASFAAGQPVAPGELISIFGQQLSGGQSPAGAGNLPTALAGTAVAIGSQTGPSAGTFQALPLYYASSGLVNAVVPFETSVNTNQEILLQWGTTYAPPVYVDVAPAAPGIFAVADLAGNVIGPNNPAQANQVVVIYCAGLGAVNPAVADGMGSTSLSYAQNPVTVMIGGQTITSPIFAGLTPGVTGLYQINIAVPQGVAPGDNVPVSIVVAGQPSAQVLTSVH